MAGRIFQKKKLKKILKKKQNTIIGCRAIDNLHNKGWVGWFVLYIISNMDGDWSINLRRSGVKESEYCTIHRSKREDYNNQACSWFWFWF